MNSERDFFRITAALAIVATLAFILVVSQEDTARIGMLVASII